MGPLWYYLIGINLLAFSLMGLDKRQARRGGRRVRERTLLLAAAAGGSVGPPDGAVTRSRGPSTTTISALGA